MFFMHVSLCIVIDGYDVQFDKLQVKYKPDDSSPQSEPHGLDDPFIASHNVWQIEPLKRQLERDIVSENSTATVRSQLTGNGVSQPHTLWIGASSLKKHLSWTVAATSCATPPVNGASWLTNSLPVLFTDVTTVSISHGTIVLKSIISHDNPGISASAILAAFSSTYSCGPYPTSVISEPVFRISAEERGST